MNNVIAFKNQGTHKPDWTRKDECRAVAQALQAGIDTLITKYFWLRQGRGIDREQPWLSITPEPGLFHTVLRIAGGDETKAAHWLKVSRYTLRRILRKSEKKETKK